MPPPGDLGARHAANIFHKRVVEKKACFTLDTNEPGVKEKDGKQEGGASMVLEGVPTPAVRGTAPDPPGEERAERPGKGDGLPTKRRKTKEGEYRSTPPKYPSAAELYRRIPQDIKRTYKAEASFHNILFLSAKEEWLDVETTRKFKAIEIWPRACSRTYQG